MSDYRSEASSRSAVKTELTSAHLECLLISLASGPSVAHGSDRFCVRECHLPLMISYFCSELLRVVHARPLASVAVGGHRYSVGYSVAREHVACDSRLRGR